MDGQTEVLELEADWLMKKVRPLHLQKENESQKLWFPVRQALAQKDFITALEKKKNVSTANVLQILIIPNMKCNISTPANSV